MVSDTRSLDDAAQSSQQSGEMAHQWNYRPPVPIEVSPVFSWPPGDRSLKGAGANYRHF